MLIDGGNVEDTGNIKKYLEANNVSLIDYLVITHPHADHIGGLPSIIDNTDIGVIYMPRVSHTTKTFESLLTSIANKGKQIDKAIAGTNILSVPGSESAPGLEIDIVAPERDKYDNLNDYSAVILITYGDTSFIFMGDAEALSEGQITADVKADVLKVGHHGSHTSTSISFLKRVDPDYAVISVGADNTYGHPTDEVLARLDGTGVSVFRTDLQGTIVFTSDSKNIKVDKKPTPYQPLSSQTESAGNDNNTSVDKAPDSAGSNDMTVYITNTGKRYHLDGCRHLSKSKIETTLSAAKAQGLTACGTCHPPE
jgi:competence protein ComEC